MKTAPLRLIFVRHAESEANAESRWQGHWDSGLSDAGRDQAQRLYERFRDEGLEPTHVYSSPLGRAAQTARIVARDWSLEIDYLDDLKETDIGVFEGLTWDEVYERYPNASTEIVEEGRWELVEGAETLKERRARAHRLIETVVGQHDNGAVVVLFSHGGILQHMLSALMGANRTWGADVQNTALFDLTLDTDRWSLDGDTLINPRLWRVNRFNDATHL